MERNRTLRFITALTSICFCLVLSTGQTRRQPPTSRAQKSTPERKRPVTIITKTGESISGNLIHVSDDVWRVNVDGTLRSISLEDVSSVTFISEASPEKVTTTKPVVRLSPQAKAAANEALKALRKMASATEVGISYQEYGTRIIDAKADVDEAIRQLPDSALKEHISLAMEAYADAARAWSQMLRYDFLIVMREPTLPEKYSIPVDKTTSIPAMTKNDVLTTIWRAAKTHIAQASSLLD